MFSCVLLLLNVLSVQGNRFLSQHGAWLAELVGEAAWTSVWVIFLDLRRSFRCQLFVPASLASMQSASSDALLYSFWVSWWFEICSLADLAQIHFWSGTASCWASSFSGFCLLKVCQCAAMNLKSLLRTGVPVDLRWTMCSLDNSKVWLKCGVPARLLVGSACQKKQV